MSFLRGRFRRPTPTAKLGDANLPARLRGSVSRPRGSSGYVPNARGLFYYQELAVALPLRVPLATRVYGPLGSAFRSLDALHRQGTRWPPFARAFPCRPPSTRTNDATDAARRPSNGSLRVAPRRATLSMF